MHARLAVPFVLPLLPLLAAPAAAQDPLVKQAVSRIERVEQQEAKLQPGDAATATTLLNDLNWAQKRLNAVGQGRDQHWQDANTRLAAVRQKVEQKQKAKAPAAAGTAATYDAAALAQLDKEIGNALHNFSLLSRQHLQDQFRVRSCEKEIADFEQRLARFPADAADVQPVAARFAEFRSRFTAAMQQLAQDQAAGGDVERRLAELDRKYDDGAVPGALSWPHDADQLRAWAGEVRRWRDTEIPQDLEFLTAAAQNAAVDQQHVQRLRHWLLDLRDRNLVTATRTVADRLQAEVRAGVDLARWILATDAKDKDQVTNRILGKGRFDENMARMRAAEQALAMAQLHDELMDGKVAAEREEQGKAITDAIAQLRQLAVATLDAVRMPAAASTDPELVQIATETLRRPGYDTGEWRRLVVNSEPVRRESREAYVSPGAVTTTVRYYHYVWDEFQVTTAETVGDQVWLFANTLKRYQSGDSTKKIGQWILSQRFELTPILPENVDR
ncbi:MAG: hypothetical protein JNL08_06910 [Planctomycetes bacterium]|nr:hypothetical protein [Planctomycetota bacterium]